jgi:hypothetical protein
MLRRAEIVPGGIRTPNLLIRSQKLYPVELQAPARDGNCRAGCAECKHLALTIPLSGAKDVCGDCDRPAF